MNYYVTDAAAEAGVTVVQIPLQNTPQSFLIALAGSNYTLTSYWNDIAQTWMLDIADSSGNPLACGLPMVVGADLLAGLAYLGIQGQLFIYTSGAQYAPPTLDNLGDTSNLYFATTVPNGN